MPSSHDIVILAQLDCTVLYSTIMSLYSAVVKNSGYSVNSVDSASYTEVDSTVSKPLDAVKTEYSVDNDKKVCK